MSEAPNLGPTQSEIYQVLAEDGGELRIAQIADRSIRLNKGIVRNSIKGLVNRDLVKERDPGDPRGWYLYSTTEGDC